MKFLSSETTGLTEFIIQVEVKMKEGLQMFAELIFFVLRDISASRESSMR